MLLKVESMCFPQFVYLPGRANVVGDALSRNPEDRDAVRDNFETGAGVPKTLLEAFKVVSDAKTSTDDADWVCDPTLTQRRLCMSADVKPEVWLEFVCSSVRVRAGVGRAVKASGFVAAVLLPSFTNDSDMDKLDGYAITGDNITIKAEIIVDPQIVCPLGTKRWLESYTGPPWAKKDRRRARLTVFDGMLTALRVVRDQSLTGVIAHGEGALVATALLSEELRAAAFKERHVNNEEAASLIEAYDGITHFILIAPQGFPQKSDLAFFRDHVPEVSCIVVPPDKQVVAIIPVKDPATDPSKIVAGFVQGCETFELEWKSPAYKNIPAPFKLPVARPVAPLRKASAVADKPKTFVEAFAGSAVLCREFLRIGFTGRAFERYPLGTGDHIADGDLSTIENQSLLKRLLLAGKIFHLHLAPDCKTFGPLNNYNPNATRTMECPQGTGGNENENEGNRGVSIAIWLMCLALAAGVFFGFEHPIRSKVWKLPFFIWLMSSGFVLVIEYDGCAWGLRPHNWHPELGDIRVQKGSRLITSNPFLEVLRKRCADVESRKHDQLIGHDAQGKSKTEASGQYDVAWAQSYALGVRKAWQQNSTPKMLPEEDAKEMKKLSIEFLLSDVDWDPSTTGIPTGEVSRPPRVIGDPLSALSAAGQSSVAINATKKSQAAVGSVVPNLVPDASDVTDDMSLAAAVGLPPPDTWEQHGDKWVRYRNRPRSRLFDPQAEATTGGPTPSMLLHNRCTYYRKPGTVAEFKIMNDFWTKESTSQRSLGYQWVGKTVFQLQAVSDSASVSDARASASDACPIVVGPAENAGAPVEFGAGVAVEPGSAPATAIYLSALRVEMAAAQRKDPTLSEIIAYLLKQPAGTFLSAPRKDLAAVRAKAVDYKLAPDGVLLQKVGDLYLPVVPNVQYAGEKAPPRMTCKHLLLASVHSTSTSVHKHAKDMASELCTLVAWQPLEKLRADCQTFVERCKSCSAVHHQTSYTPVSRPIIVRKPYARMQIDLMEIRPTSEEGYAHLFTACCVATRYIFMRPVITRDMGELAEIMTDIILEAGVVPKVIQGDSEFCNIMLEELTGLLGANQLFSTALRPQAVGIKERQRREIREGLAILVESLSRALPRRWPKYVKWLEAKIRHKKLPSGFTPFQLIHGFLGSSALRSALDSFAEIPADMVCSDWLREIVSEAKSMTEATVQIFEEEDC
ncbi:unnamed protein product [Polarella glacialis]|uniref:Integrase catalytic domain-containing protein n=2 Tax=Polarella glacialis TaxID=89957 RepID=A0A813DEZ9_POLGL|nr:unnamed protein product [Polarella glacialis]